MSKTSNDYELHDGKTEYDLEGDFLVEVGDAVFEEGEVLRLLNNDNSFCPKFISKDGLREGYFLWKELKEVEPKPTQENETDPLPDVPPVGSNKHPLKNGSFIYDKKGVFEVVGEGNSFYHKGALVKLVNLKDTSKNPKFKSTDNIALGRNGTNCFIPWKDLAIHNQYALLDGSRNYNKGAIFIVTGRECQHYSKGAVVQLHKDDGSSNPKFKTMDGKSMGVGGSTAFISWNRLLEYKEFTNPPKPLCGDCLTRLESCGACPHCKLADKPATGPLSNDPLVNPKKAAGAVKAPMHTLPTLAMIQMANVMAGGAFKYGFHNFRESKIDAQTYIGAINRHFLKWQDGVDFDEESRQHELAHVMSCCAILIDAHYTNSMIDNRSKTGLVEEMLKGSEEAFKDFIANNKSLEEK